MTKNVLGKTLESCCSDPVTGFYRDGFCRTGPHDTGQHCLCAILTDEFLQFSLDRGNDLITPQPLVQFPGLKAGDGWCLCISRWLEAHQAGCAPPLKLSACHESALERVGLDILSQYAASEM